MNVRSGVCGGVLTAGMLLFLASSPPAMAIPSHGYRPSWDYSWLTKRNGIRNVVFGAGAILVVTITMMSALGSGSGKTPDKASSTDEQDVEGRPSKVDPADYPNAGIMAWVVGVVSADGTINSSELDWLAEFSERVDVPWALVSQMIADVRADSLNLVKPASENEALDWLNTLIGSALVDGSINNAEGKVLMIMADHLNMSKRALLQHIRQRRQDMEMQESVT